MGLIFDKKTAQLYNSWYGSSQGRAIDGSIEQMIVALLRPKPKDRVLDIGCGSGNHLIVFNRLGLDVSGIDASPHMIRQVEERLGHRYSLKTGTAEALPFEDNGVILDVLAYLFDFRVGEDPLKKGECPFLGDLLGCPCVVMAEREIEGLAWFCGERHPDKTSSSRKRAVCFRVQ